MMVQIRWEEPQCFQAIHLQHKVLQKTPPKNCVVTKNICVCSTAKCKTKIVAERGWPSCAGWCKLTNPLRYGALIRCVSLNVSGTNIRLPSLISLETGQIMHHWPGRRHRCFLEAELDVLVQARHLWPEHDIKLCIFAQHTTQAGLDMLTPGQLCTAIGVLSFL